MCEWSPQEFALVIFMGACERKSRSKLRTRRQSLIVDDCIEMLREGPLCPSLITYNRNGLNPEEARRRKLCGETLAYFEQIAPIVRAMTERAER